MQKPLHRPYSVILTPHFLGLCARTENPGTSPDVIVSGKSMDELISSHS